MIARQLSNKLKDARLAQRRTKAPPAEDAMTDGAAAEVRVLVARGRRYERRVAALERSLAQSSRELSDLKLITASSQCLLLLGFATLFNDLVLSPTGVIIVP